MPIEQSSFPEGKIAIVTGGSRGLGRNMVLSLARRGVRSIFTYNSNWAEADKVAAEVREMERLRPICAGSRQSSGGDGSGTLSTTSTSRACSS